MGFGASVTALLATYSNCLSLLKAYRHRSGDAESRKSDQQSLLRKSLRADRATVERAYSSRLSQSGGRFEKGDARARSALSRTLKKLSAAIVNLLHLASSKDRNPVLDYDSLMALSNSSRIEAVKAMDQLSQRLGGSSSRSSAASSNEAIRHRRRKSSSSSSSSTSARSGKSKASGKGAKAAKEADKSKRSSRSSSSKGKTKFHEEPAPMADKKAPTSPSRQSATLPAIEKPHARTGSRSPRMERTNRVSMMTISSESTKLGEVPERRWHAHYVLDSNAEEYNVRPVFPLRPIKPEVKQRRFFGLFKRG